MPKATESHGRRTSCESNLDAARRRVGLQLRLRASATVAPRRRARLPVFKGRGGLVAGVDPLSNKSMLEALGDDA